MSDKPAPDEPVERPDWLALASRLGELLLESATGERPGAPGAPGGAAWAAATAEPGPGDSGEPGHDPLACRFCPLCQAIAWLYRTHPEVAGQLAGAAAGLTSVVREVLESAAADHPPPGPDPDAAAEPGTAGDAGAPPEPEPVRRERIIVTD